MKDYEKQKKEAAAKQAAENKKNSLQQMASQIGSTKQLSGVDAIADGYDLKLQLIKQIFELLSGGKNVNRTALHSMQKNGMLNFSNTNLGSCYAGTGEKVLVQGEKAEATGSNATLWTKVTATSGFYTEAESTTFATKGLVQTTDGRSIDFNVEVSMSRAFTANIDTMTAETYLVTDPLVINMDTDLTSVTDQKFFFDIDSDGKEEEMSFAGSGSGFLALDKNGDGIINDGSELFGTKSGDGFADLAAYDEDGNGWIDENDSIYRKLKVWTKDENGNDYLINLKQADVGAIYLGSADTEFSLKNDANETNAIVRKTGVYLHESTGEVGTVNHVDLAL